MTAHGGDVIMTHVQPNFFCEVRLPADAKPGSTCSADVWGYAVVPADVWALGLCLFILAFQCPLWETAKLSNRYFAHFNNNGEKGLESLLTLWNKQRALSPEAMGMVSDMLQTDPAKRPSAASCLNYSWFAPMTNKQVELHSGERNN